MVEKLIAALEKIDSDLSELLVAAKMKQASLVSNVNKKIEEAILLEEKLLLKIKNGEHNRLTIIKQIYEAENVHLETTRISDLIIKFSSEISGEDKEKLTRLEKSIKHRISEVKRNNEHNQFLINHSRNFINQTISALVEKSKKSILDKKI